MLILLGDEEPALIVILDVITVSLLEMMGYYAQLFHFNLKVIGQNYNNKNFIED